MSLEIRRPEKDSRPRDAARQFAPQVAIAVHDAVDVVAFDDSLTSRCAERHKFRARQPQQLDNRFAQTLRVLFRDDAAGVADDFGAFADVGGHARDAAGHGFADDVRKSFGHRRADQHIEAGVDGRHVSAHAQPMKTVAQADVIDPTPEITGRNRLLFTRTNEMRVRKLIGDESCRADECAMVFVLMQPPDHSDERRVIGQSEFVANPQPRGGVRSQFAQIEAIRDDFQFFRRVADSQVRRAGCFGAEHDAIRHQTGELTADPCRPAHRP